MTFGDESFVGGRICCNDVFTPIEEADSSSVSECVPPLERDVQEIMEMGKNLHWHIVCDNPSLMRRDLHNQQSATSEGSSEGRGADAQGSSEEPAEWNRVPKGTVAILLLLSEYRDISQIQRIVRRLRLAMISGKRKRVPLIACVLGGDASLVDDDAQEAIVKVQRQLRGSALDDIFPKLGNAAAIRLAVSMSIVRAREKQALKERVLLAEKGEEPKVGLFWQSAHRIFDELPQLDEDLPVLPDVGCEMGPCVLTQHLGSGGFSQVFAAANLETGETEALKAVDKDKMPELCHVSNLWKEIRVLKRLHHNNIVEFRGVLHGPCHIFLRMEMPGSLNIWKAMKLAGGRFNLSAARGFQAQIAQAIAHCHSLEIVHRDLKPENVAITDDLRTVKVLDFGSGVQSDRQCWDKAGTMPFMSPQVLLASAENPYEPMPCDIWSMGVLLVEMLCGLTRLNAWLDWPKNINPLPQCAEELERFFTQPGALRECVEADIGSAVSEDLIILLHGMLSTEVSSRWSASEVCRAAFLRSPASTPQQAS